MKRFLHSLKFSMLWPMIAILLTIVVLLTIIVTNTYTDTLLRQEDAKTEAAFGMISDAIQKSVKKIEKISSDAVMNQESLRYSLEEFYTPVEQVRARIRFSSSIETIMKSLSGIYGIAFVNEKGTVYGKTLDRSYFFESLEKSPLAGTIANEIRSVMNLESKWIGPYPGHNLIDLTPEPEYPKELLIYIRRMATLHYGSMHVIVFVQPEIFIDYLQYAYDGFNGVSLLDENAQIICSLGKENGPMSEIHSLLENIENQGRIFRTQKNEHLYICSEKVPGTNWLLLKEMPMEDYIHNIQHLRLTIWSVTGVLLVIAILFYFHWMKHFLRTFNSLKDGIIRLRKGDMETRLEQPFHINEFDDIRTEFNLMNQSLLKMIEEKSRMEREQLKLELQNLQSQLSPHMIFNSLTAIRWMSSINGMTQVADMLKELGEMLRPVFREWRTQWTLREEMEHLTHYSRLLKLRFGAKFTMNYEIPDEFMEMVLPRFTLQPLVENACEHGRKGFESLTVSIKARREEGFIVLSVWNNGKNIEEENLRKIREMLQDGNGGTGVGIRNIYRRMLIFMGKDSKMEIECPPEGGTLVTMRWPELAVQR